MAAVTSTFKNPDSTFVWWIEGDKIAIATTEGDADTRNTQLGQYKAAVIGSGSDYVDNGMLISYYAEPDEYTRGKFSDMQKHLIRWVASLDYENRERLAKAINNQEERWTE